MQGLRLGHLRDEILQCFVLELELKSQKRAIRTESGLLGTHYLRVAAVHEIVFFFMIAAYLLLCHVCIC